MAERIPGPSKGPEHPLIRHDKVRAVMTLYRKEGMSPEDFSTYWRETHAQLFASLPIVKRNLTKYEQIHCHHETFKSFQEAKFSTAEYDGLAVFDAPSVEKLIEVFTDEEYKKTVIPDEENFLERKKVTVFPAEVVTVFSDPS